MFELGVFVGAAGMWMLVVLWALAWHAYDLLRDWWAQRHEPAPAIQPKGVELIDMEVRPW